MIRLSLEDDTILELSQEEKDGNINVDVLDQYGDVEYSFDIVAKDMMKLINQYQIRENII